MSTREERRDFVFIARLYLSFFIFVIILVVMALIGIPAGVVFFGFILPYIAIVFVATFIRFDGAGYFKTYWRYVRGDVE